MWHEIAMDNEGLAGYELRHPPYIGGSRIFITAPVNGLHIHSDLERKKIKKCETPRLPVLNIICIHAHRKVHGYMHET